MTMLRRLRSSAFASTFATLAIASVPAAEPALVRLAPPDAALVVSIANVPASRARFAATPFGRAWSDPLVRRFVAPRFSHPDYLAVLQMVKNETGHTPEELLGFVAGDVLLTMPLSSFKLGPDTRLDVPFLLAVEVGENETKIRELIARRRAGNQGAGSPPDRAEDHHGVELHTLAPSAGSLGRSLAWAVHQGRWFVGTDRDLVAGALDALAAGGRSEALSDSPVFRTVRERAGGDAAYVAFADFQALYPVLKAAAEAARNPAKPSSPFDIDPLSVMRALGLDSLGVVSATGVIHADGSTAGDLAVAYEDVRGLIGMLAYKEGPIARPDWVPSSWLSVTSRNFSLAELYAEIEQTLARFNPILASIAQGQIKAIERQIKVSLKRDILATLGVHFVSGAVPAPGSSPANPTPYDELDQFHAFSLVDPAGFERAAEILRTSPLPPGGKYSLESREHLGRAVHVVTPRSDGAAPPARGFAYAVSDGWLLVSFGSSAPIETVIQNMQATVPDASFWARADVRRAIHDAPTSASSIQVTDLPPLFASLCAMAVKAQALRENKEPTPPLVDTSAQPTIETFEKYRALTITVGERTSNEIRFRHFTPGLATP